MLYRTDSPEATTEFGRALGGRLQPGDVILLGGGLGAGKSVLARGLARGLGITQAMPSPTFTLMQPYQGRIPFYHFDLYRLDDPDQFYEAGLDEFVGGDGAAVVEWPGCADLSPEPRMDITLSRCEDSDDARLISLELVGLDGRRAGILESLSQWRLDP
ncbi:MAG: tRNA (adenosine(37)-N6)-threonylcarbamoyltransferase complex ATPase subunit type 1 TsaE [Clostridia bacterium]|nr:tRNA (adenosine(37)-N6)-threonylcarbamoyltransferase complex ATPase subunit type 1 TsaE [Clostridia bacterium]